MILPSRAEWETLKQKNETRLAVGDDPDAYLSETQETIADLLAQLPDLLAREDYLTVNEEGHLRLTPQEKTTPEAVDSWRHSCLMLLVGMIAAWNTVYLDQIAVSLQEHGTPVPTEYLQHISPLSWRHINFLGRYEFDLDLPYSLDNLRPLRSVAR